MHTSQSTATAFTFVDIQGYNRSIRGASVVFNSRGYPLGTLHLVNRSRIRISISRPFVSALKGPEDCLLGKPSDQPRHATESQLF